jgi:hypothetical protein
VIAEAQESLDIERGPVFSVDLFDVVNDGQYIFLAAHHLCIDMVSWRIILQDFEEFVGSGSFGSQRLLSFQAWCELQSQQTQKQGALAPLPFNVTPINLAYWGLDGQANTYGQAEMESFTLDERLTELALGSSLKAFNMEPTDLFVSAIAYSFSKVFSDRIEPTIYIESHGRESAWDTSIDLSRTVGWFTTVAPFVARIGHGLSSAKFMN